MATSRTKKKTTKKPKKKPVSKPKTRPTRDTSDDVDSIHGKYGSDFSESFQTHLLTVAARLPDAVLRYRPVFDYQYFNGGTNRAIAKVLLRYVDKNQHVPTIVTLKQLVRKEYEQETADTACAALDKMTKTDISDAEGVLDMVVDFGKNQALSNAVLESAEAINKGEPDKVRPLIDSAMLVGVDLHNMGIDYDEPGLRHALYTDPENMVQTIPTGLSHLDQAIKGGLGRGELGVIFAPPKRGKSTVLINIAYGALTQADQYNVVYVSCELYQNRVAMRFDDRLSEVSMHRLKKKDPEAYARALDKRANEVLTGHLSIKQYPTRSLVPSTLRSYLTILRAQGFPPDLVVVDYADIMRAERRLGEMRHEQAGIYEDLRQIAGEFDAAIWTGSQTNKASLLKDTMDIGDLAEAFEKAAIADALIAFCQTDEEKRQNHCRLALAALRNSEDGGVIDCNIHRGLCRVTSVGLYNASGDPIILPSDPDKLKQAVKTGMLPSRAMTIKGQMDPDHQEKGGPGARPARRTKKKVSKSVDEVIG